MAHGDEGEQKVWSLALELGTLGDAIGGARLLIERSADHGTYAEDDEVRGPWAAAAVLTLVHGRLLDLGRVLRGELDPAWLWNHANATTPGRDPPEACDPAFAPWTPAQERADARRTLRRIKRAAQRADETPPRNDPDHRT